MGFANKHKFIGLKMSMESRWESTHTFKMGFANKSMLTCVDIALEISARSSEDAPKSHASLL
ncbi:hypothetical protein PJP10_32270, partial [Mycobacterium kansasii]